MTKGKTKEVPAPALFGAPIFSKTSPCVSFLFVLRFFFLLLFHSSSRQRQLRNNKRKRWETAGAIVAALPGEADPEERQLTGGPLEKQNKR